MLCEGGQQPASFPRGDLAGAAAAGQKDKKGRRRSAVKGFLHKLQGKHRQSKDDLQEGGPSEGIAAEGTGYHGAAGLLDTPDSVHDGVSPVTGSARDEDASVASGMESMESGRVCPHSGGPLHCRVGNLRLLNP